MPIAFFAHNGIGVWCILHSRRARSWISLIPPVQGGIVFHAELLEKPGEL